MAKKEENAVTRFVLRLPTQLCNQVKKRAKANNRSMNSEIINILKAWNVFNSTNGRNKNQN